MTDLGLFVCKFVGHFPFYHEQLGRQYISTYEFNFNLNDLANFSSPGPSQENQFPAVTNVNPGLEALIDH